MRSLEAQAISHRRVSSYTQITLGKHMVRMKYLEWTQTQLKNTNLLSFHQVLNLSTCTRKLIELMLSTDKESCAWLCRFGFKKNTRILAAQTLFSNKKNILGWLLFGLSQWLSVLLFYGETSMDNNYRCLGPTTILLNLIVKMSWRSKAITHQCNSMLSISTRWWSFRSCSIQVQGCNRAKTICIIKNLKNSPDNLLICW